MKNAAIDRAVAQIVITSDSERAPTTQKRYASALLVFHLLNRLYCPLCPFFGKAFLLFLFLPSFFIFNFLALCRHFS